MKVSIDIINPTEASLTAGVAAAAQGAKGLPCITFEYECNGGMETLTVCQNIGETYADFVARAYKELAEAKKSCE